MPKPSDESASWESLRESIIGLGETSLRKSYYPELRKRLAELERFRTLVDQSNDAIFVIAMPAGRVVDANLTACRLVGYSLTELKDFDFSRLLSADLHRALAQQSQAANLGDLVCTELITAAGDVVPVELGLHLVSYGQEQYAITVARDISERRSAEAEMRRLEMQLVQAQKMESIGRLAGGVAHDFNNILSTIMGYTELLLQDCHAEENREALNEIWAAGGRARDLTRQLLAFSRKQVLELPPMNINTVVKGFEKMLGRLIGEDIEVRTVLEPQLGQVMADVPQVEQIILNLAVNARDAMNGGGKLTIETRNTWLDSEYARLHSDVEPGPYVMLAVSDTGSGMDSATMAQIFEPFFTTKERGKGTGLGLATVYGIVKQHGGSIWLYSEKGLGTTFKIYLPRIRQQTQSTNNASGASELQTCSARVLLVEDDAKLADMVSKMLGNLGCAVIVARDSFDAVECARHDQSIDLMLSDVIMPGLSGRQVYEEIAKFRPELKVLFMSGYTDDIIAQHGVLDAGMHFLQKPFTTHDLLAKLRETIGEPA